MVGLPSVRAILAERYLFNFRMPPRSLADFLPAPWLKPQLINGHGVVSFCLLNLRNITLAPLPAVAGLSSMSCAPRYAVVDHSLETPEPAVFVTERFTNNAFGAWFTTLGFSAPHPVANVAIRPQTARTALRVDTPKEGQLFSATVRPARESGSALFSSAESFASFIAEGVMSYGLSRHRGRLTKMDLRKGDNAYKPLAVDDVGGPIVAAWEAAGATLDSAFYTRGGQYQWNYHGLVDQSSGQAA